MELKKGPDVSPCDKRTVGHRGGEQPDSGLSFGGVTGWGPFLLGKWKDTVPPPEGRIATWDQIGLRGCKGFLLSPALPPCQHCFSSS